MAGKSSGNAENSMPPLAGVHIPLPFADAVGGLLNVNPKQPVESVRKKPAKKKGDGKR